MHRTQQGYLDPTWETPTDNFPSKEDLTEPRIYRVFDVPPSFVVETRGGELFELIDSRFNVNPASVGPTLKEIIKDIVYGNSTTLYQSRAISLICKDLDTRLIDKDSKQPSCTVWSGQFRHHLASFASQTLRSLYVCDATISQLRRKVAFVADLYAVGLIPDDLFEKGVKDIVCPVRGSRPSFEKTETALYYYLARGLTNDAHKITLGTRLMVHNVFEKDIIQYSPIFKPTATDPETFAAYGLPRCSNGIKKFLNLIHYTILESPFADCVLPYQERVVPVNYRRQDIYEQVSCVHILWLTLKALSSPEISNDPSRFASWPLRLPEGPGYEGDFPMFSV